MAELTGATPAERAVLDAALQWYADYEPWPKLAPDEPEYALKAAVELLKAEQAQRERRG